MQCRGDGGQLGRWRAQWQRRHGGARCAGAGNSRAVEITFMEVAEDDSQTNRVEASVEILVGVFGPSWPTVTGAFGRPEESISDNDNM